MSDEIFSALNRADYTALTPAQRDQLRYLDPQNVVTKNSDRLALNAGFAAQNNCGHFAPATILLSTNPTHQDSLTIGADVYEFINTATGTVVADDGNVAVAIGANAAATQANLLAALNGTAAAEHATITLADTETPAIGVGSLPMYGVVNSNVLSLFYSKSQGKSPLSITQAQWATMPAAVPSIALSDDLTASVAWSHTNMNQVPYFNGALGVVSRSASVQITVTAAMIAAGMVTVIFRVGAGAGMAMHVTCYTASGVIKVPAADTFTLNTTTGFLDIAFNDDTGDLDATDVIHVTVASNNPA